MSFEDAARIGALAIRHLMRSYEAVANAENTPVDQHAMYNMARAKELLEAAGMEQEGEPQ